MKTKQIALEPYLTVIHSWNVLSKVLSPKYKSLENILQEEIEEAYQGELTYYFNSLLKDACPFSNHKRDGLIWSYICCFKESLNRLVEFTFNSNGKIRNFQLYKQATAYVLKEIFIFWYMKKNGIPLRRVNREVFYEIPYYIDNLRETHLHAGLAFDIFDVIEFAIRNFRKFSIELKKVSNRISKRKTAEVLERFKLIINLYALLMCLDTKGEAQDKKKRRDYQLSSESGNKKENQQTKKRDEPKKRYKSDEMEILISYVHKINKGLSIPQKVEYLKDFSLEKLLTEVIANLYELEHVKPANPTKIGKYLASVILIVNLNELLKVNTDRTLYRGLEYFSDEFIKKNPIKVAASRIVKGERLFELYESFFKKSDRVKAFELRMYPEIKSLKFWHSAINQMASEEQKKRLSRFLNRGSEKKDTSREVKISTEDIERALKNQDFNFLSQILNSVLKRNSDELQTNRGIDKEFSLIFHFGKIREPSEFEKIKRFYRRIYRTARKFANFLRDNGEYVAFFAGIDAASIEYWTPAWVFAPLYSFWRNFAVHYIPDLDKKKTALKFTYHAGEDFVDLGTGLKNIYEAVKFLNLGSGDRIGHGLAFGTDVRSYSLKHRKVCISPLYYFFHLLWLNYMAYRHGELVGYKKRILREVSQLESNYEFVRKFLSSLTESREGDKTVDRYVDDVQVFLVNLYESLKYDFVNRGDYSLFGRFWNAEVFSECKSKKGRASFLCKVISLLPRLFSEYEKEKRSKGRSFKYVVLDPLLDEKSDVDFEEQLKILEKIKEITLKLVIEKGIVIEACPTSNVYIRGIVDYKDHLTVRLREEIVEKGLRITLNTDDPLIFNNVLIDEYLLVLEALPDGEGERVIRKLIENADNFSFKT